MFCEYSEMIRGIDHKKKVLNHTYEGQKGKLISLKIEFKTISKNIFDIDDVYNSQNQTIWDVNRTKADEPHDGVKQ